MTDIQAEINAKEKCQEQLNIIYQNALILSGDTTKFKDDYLSKLETDISNAWSECCKIAMSMIDYKSLPMPKPLDETAMTDAGIIPTVDDTQQVIAPSVN